MTLTGSLTRRTWLRLERLRRQRKLQNISALGLVVLGPVLAVLTYSVMGEFSDQLRGDDALRLVLLADLIYLLVLTGLVIARMVQIVAARRKSAAGSRLHMRLVGVFAGITLVPTVLVAIFAGLTFTMGLEGWFSNRVQQVVHSSLAAAEAYQDEHRRDLTKDAQLLGDALKQAARADPMMDDGEMRQLLGQGQALIQRGLREAYVIDGRGEIRARGERSYQFWYEAPSEADFDGARRHGLVLIEDWPNNEFRALVPLPPLADRFLYVTRDVDGSLLGLLDDTRQTVSDYQRLEQERGRVLLEFSALYLGFALLLVVAATWFGLWFAERLSRPIGRLAEASEQVGQGNLDLQIPEAQTGDEIQTLGESFNRMTRQLKAQRVELMASYGAAEDQRRLFDSVLTSVTSGVIGLDAAGEIDFLNRSATRLLGLQPGRDHDVLLGDAVPEFAHLFDRLANSVAEAVQDEVRLTRDGRVESLLVRMAIRRGAAGALEGYVVAFDDVTELVSAQRMAAWGDVARRVAHEIKNPLTPIQLSAERIKRKFSKVAGDDLAALEQYTDVIIRQTNDLRRIVDEFSRFARMPEPDRKETDLAKLLKDAVLLQEDALKGTLQSDIPDEPVIVDCDPLMMHQVFTNLLKNAGEAVEEYGQATPEPGWSPRVLVSLRAGHDGVTLRIIDNGAGLPEDRTRLLEPYVTMKPGGTGLGLPIVKKIIEEHGGTLTLTDAPPDTVPAGHSTGQTGAHGAMVEVRLLRERHSVRLSNRRSKNEQEVV